MTIPRRILDLMNGEIDAVNTPAETAELSEFLANDPEAVQYYSDLRAGLRLVDEVGPSVPPADLEADVMSVIESRGVTGTRRRLDQVLLGALRSVLRPAPGLAFVAGLLAGAVILSSVREGGTESRDRNLGDFFGAAVPGKETGRPVASVPVEATVLGFATVGEVEFRATDIRIRLEVDAPEDATVALLFDERLSCEGYLITGTGEGRVLAEPGRLTIRPEGRITLQVLLENALQIASGLRLQVRVGDEVRVEREIAPQPSPEN